MRRWTYISHIALGFSGALFFLALIYVMLSRLPVIDSLLAHSDQAAANTVKATGVIANASVEQAKQAVTIERDFRTLAWHVDRSMLKVNALLDSSNDVVKYHVGPLLDSVRKATDAIPETLKHVEDTADSSKAAIDSVKQVSDDVHATITDKRTSELITYLHDTGEHISSMSASGDKILSDGQWRAHQILHPDAKTKVKLGFWGSTWAGLQYLRSDVMPKISLF
jgi:hypothetical protein